MKKETILITGAGPNGITGRRIKEYLEKLSQYIILTPSSKELDLKDFDAVSQYFDIHDIDYVIHSALSSPSREYNFTNCQNEVEDNLRMYFNLSAYSHKFKKMFYFGSGAEFDKSKDINDIKEEESDIRIPKDKYGFVKFILNRHASKSDNIYNIRLFGTINPYEPYGRNVISNLCAKAACKMPLRLRRDCNFSFVDIDDVARFIDFGIKNGLNFHDYNMTSGKYCLSQIMDFIKNKLCDYPVSLSFEDDGFNHEYTADNDRLLGEFQELTPITESIIKVYNYIIKNVNNINQDMMDSRWYIDSSGKCNRSGGVISILSTRYNRAA